jgi:hypothetical protein
MIKAALLFLTSCSIAAAGAQPGLAKKILVYGTGNYYSSQSSQTISSPGSGSHTTNNPKIRNYSIAPGIGYQLTDKLAAGAEFSYGASQTESDKEPGSLGTYKSKNRAFSVGPFVRYTQPLGEHFLLIGQFTARYFNGRSIIHYYPTVTGPAATAEDRSTGVNLELSPAFGIRVTRSVALTFGFGGLRYNADKTTVDPTRLTGYPAGTEMTARNSGFVASFGQQFSFGVQKYFGGRKARGHRQPMDDTRVIDQE